jgi:hypothetical protein
MASVVRAGGRLAGGVAILCAAFGVGRPAAAAPIVRNVNVTLNASKFEDYNLDVNLDGKTDFSFFSFLEPGFAGGAVVDFPFGTSNGVVIDFPTPDGFPTASRLTEGDVVSAASTFSFPGFDQGNLAFFTLFDPLSGNFPGKTGFIGLRFDTAGGTVYGFAEITVNALSAANNPLGLTIGRVGYETVPGRPITVAVPEPGSAAVAAILLGGLAVARRRLVRPAA